MINGLTHGLFHDDKRFWPVYQRAAALGVPIYIHAALPQQAVIDIYYKDYAQTHPGILRAAWGFTVETATLISRPQETQPTSSNPIADLSDKGQPDRGSRR